MAQRSTLANLAQLAALYYGTKQRRRDVMRSNEEELAQRNAQNQFRRDQLTWQQEQERGRQKADEQDRKQRERTARLGQVRSAVMPLLQMGRTAEEQANLSRDPARYQALVQDQADIMNLLASGDEAGWETFRPRFYGGAGFVPPSQGPGFSGMGAGSQAPPVGAPPEGMGAEWGPWGPPINAPSVGMGQPPVPQAPQTAAAPPMPTWMQKPLPLPAKTQAQINAQNATAGLAGERKTDLSAKRPVDIAKKKADTALAVLKGGTEKGKAGREDRKVGALEKSVGIRGEQVKGSLALGWQRDETARRGQDIGAATARRGQDINAQTAEANRQSREKLLGVGTGKVPSAQLATYRQYVKVLTDVNKDPMDGSTSGYKYPDGERMKAARGIQSMGQKYGLDLTGFTWPSGAESGGGDSASTGGGRGPTPGQIAAVKGLSSADYNAAFAAATPEEKALLKAARAAGRK